MISILPSSKTDLFAGFSVYSVYLKSNSAIRGSDFLIDLIIKAETIASLMFLELYSCKSFLIWGLEMSSMLASSISLIKVVRFLEPGLRPFCRLGSGPLENGIKF